MKFNFHGITSFLLTALGVLASPAVLGLVPPKYAAAAVAVGALYAAVSKPAVQSGAAS